MEDGSECAVVGGVVELVVLPAPPDHVQPGAGDDPHGVWVAMPAGAGVLVELRDGVLRLDVDVPPDSTAEVRLPDGRAVEAGPGHHTWRCA
jgi:hypothetical protein